MKRARIAAALGLSLVGLGLVGGLGLRDRALSRAEATMRSRGLSWTGRQAGLLGARWTGITGPGIQAAAVQAQLLPRPRVQVEQAELDLAALDRASLEGAGGEGPGGEGAAADVPVELREGRLRWGDRVLVEGLSGSLRPTLDLVAPGAWVRRQDGQLQAHLEQLLDLGWLQAHLSVELSQDGSTLGVDLRAEDAVITRPLLAARALPPAPLHLHGSFHPADGVLDAQVSLAGVQGHLAGTLHDADATGPRRADLALDLDEVPLTAILDLFGDQVPEARRAHCTGTVGLHLSVSTPPLRWQAQPRARDLACSGLLSDVDGLQSGRVTWRAHAPDGSPVVRHTGPGEAGFTSWLDGQTVAAAMIASEDAGFLSHPGYDLSAIQEALDEAAAGADRPRGGSTLTQQLAKNLYLDGERTLARKLRELLYALSLEQALDKRHLLQLYINVVELGPDLYGVGPAAQEYFAKDPRGLTDKEAAFLATLLPNPTRGHARAMAGRSAAAHIDGILDNMARAGFRSRDQVARDKAQRLVILLPPEEPGMQGPGMQGPGSAEATGVPDP